MGKEKNSPAYPQNNEDLIEHAIAYGKSPKGMSKRFYAACQAIVGIASMEKMKSPKEMVERAYKIADEMLKQENE